MIIFVVHIYIEGKKEMMIIFTKKIIITDVQ